MDKKTITPTTFLVLLKALILFIFTVAVFAAIAKIFFNDNQVTISLFSSAAITTSAIVALGVLEHTKKNSQEPWMKIFFESHNDLWNNKTGAKARTLIINDYAYNKELVPILNSALSNKNTPEEYKILDQIDQFLAIILRITCCIEKLNPMPKNQLILWEDLGYSYWTKQIIRRTELRNYVSACWEPLERILKELESVPDKLGKQQQKTNGIIEDAKLMISTRWNKFIKPITGMLHH